ncbi:hypothetical protein J3R82DRAFT_11393 [Butyriboletus roseoflavus]|nr:hypothetical protein J3R82DRAFT_11393 [Butyriboletus roseoflavus]
MEAVWRPFTRTSDSDLPPSSLAGHCFPFTLGKWSSLGYLKGTIGASGLYALVFGLMGLLPAPMIRRS